MGRGRSSTHFPASCLWLETKRNDLPGFSDHTTLPSGRQFTEVDSVCSLVVSPQPGPSSLQGLTSGLPWASPLNSCLGQRWCREIRSRESYGGEVCRVAGDLAGQKHKEYGAPEGEEWEHCRSADQRRAAPGPGARERSRSLGTLTPFPGLAAPSAEDRLPRKRTRPPSPAPRGKLQSCWRTFSMNCQVPGLETRCLRGLTTVSSPARWLRHSITAQHRPPTGLRTPGFTRD